MLPIFCINRFRFHESPRIENCLLSPLTILSNEKVSLLHFFYLIYTASKVKHHLNIFLGKTVKLSKHEFIFVTCLKRDKVVTIYSKFRFDYQFGKRSGKENAHAPLKISRFSTPLWHFQTDRSCILLVSYCYNTKDMFCLKISDEYF